KAFERTATLPPIGFEVGTANRAAARSKAQIGCAQRSEFQRRDRGVIDKLGDAQLLNVTRETCHAIGLEFLDRLHIDVERIEELTAVRRIRTARTFGTIVELSMQRVETNAGAAKAGDDSQQLGEVGEIAVAPVASRPDAVKLDRQQPDPLPVALKGRFCRLRLSPARSRRLPGCR